MFNAVKAGDLSVRGTVFEPRVESRGDLREFHGGIVSG
jgi:hypothetical protein